MFDDIVYQRMRHILMSYRNLRTSTDGRLYGWGELAGDISVYCDKPFPRNSLENFVRGWDEDQGDKGAHLNNSSGPRIVHKFSTPAPDRIDAIIEFLTDPESKGYFCEKAVLLACSTLQAPYFLQHYLDNESGPDDFYQLDQFKNDFHCRYHWAADDRSYDLVVTLLTPLANKAALVDVAIQSILVPGDYAHATRLIDDEPQLYQGWCVHSHSHNMFVFVKHVRTRRTVFYLAIGYGRLSGGHPFPDRLVLLEHLEPLPGFGESGETGYPATLGDIKEELLDRFFDMALDKG
ncbi:Uncharacterised protein [Halioglobus japonicus]|nr:Uncharacterised protein [Halioglobus japonicus]